MKKPVPSGGQNNISCFADMQPPCSKSTERVHHHYRYVYKDANRPLQRDLTLLSQIKAKDEKVSSGSLCLLTLIHKYSCHTQTSGTVLFAESVLN